MTTPHKSFTVCVCIHINIYIILSTTLCPHQIHLKPHLKIVTHRSIDIWTSSTKKLCAEWIFKCFKSMFPSEITWHKSRVHLSDFICSALSVAFSLSRCRCVRMIKTFEIYRLYRNGKSLMMIVVSLSCFFLRFYQSHTLVHSLNRSLVITVPSTPTIRKFSIRTNTVCTNCTFLSQKNK